MGVEAEAGVYERRVGLVEGREWTRWGLNEVGEGSGRGGGGV